MRKEMILNKEDLKQAEKSVMLSTILSPILYVIDMMARYFTFVLEEKYTRRSTLLMLNVLLAFTLAAFPADISLTLRALFTVWFGVSIKLFRRYRYR